MEKSERVEWNSQPKPPREWLVSACTTFHCTPFRHLFVTPPAPVANLQQLDCFYGNCNLKLKVKAVGKVVVNGCTLDNVLYVPRLNQNHFSCMQEGVDYLNEFRSSPELKSLELPGGRTLTAMLKNGTYVVLNEDMEEEGTVGFLGTALPLSAVNEYQWVLSAECTNHCCIRRNLFHELEKVSTTTPRYLSLLDGTLCEVKGIGTVNINGFQLANVYFVPSYSVNIISIIRLVFEGFQVSCEMDDAKVLNSPTKPFAKSVFTAEKCGHSYMFDPHRFQLTSDMMHILKEYHHRIEDPELRRTLRFQLLTPSPTFYYSTLKWLLSTTATQHVCKNESLILNYSEPPANWRIKYGITGMGKVQLPDRTINVKHIPSYLVNILSVSELVAEGYKVIYQPFHVLVMKNYNTTILQSQINYANDPPSFQNHTSIHLAMVSFSSHSKPNQLGMVNGNGMVNCEQNSIQWLVDTDIQEHYTNNCDIMLDYRQFPELRQHMIDGQPYELKGEGSVSLKCGISLRDVLFVPKLKHNFISTQALSQKDGYYVGVLPNELTITHMSTKQVLLRTTLNQDGFWVIDDN